MERLSTHSRIDTTLIAYSVIIRVISKLLVSQGFQETPLKIQLSKKLQVKVIHPDMYTLIFLKSNILEIEKLVQEELLHSRAKVELYTFKFIPR